MARNRNYINKSVDEKRTEYSPAEVERTGPETKNGTIVNSLHVKVRKEPSPESEVVEVLSKGDKVTITGHSGQYYQVSTSVNTVAYIFCTFVEEE